ncbi:MAG: hypothetical protein ACFFCD_07255 [Promethearchaeota archaeon]
MPIHNVLILKSSGQNIFSWTQRSFNLDDDLLSSFTSAIFTFVSELGERSIEIMDLENLKFLYSYEPMYELIFSMSIDRADEKQINTFKTVLAEIKTAFIEKYSTFLKKWNGEVSIFNEFGKEVEKIVKTIQEYKMDYIVAVPFLLDENNTAEKTTFQKEVALMFSLSEDERGKGGGRILKKPSESFEYLAKVLWPFWIINTKQGSVIVDGFALSSQTKVITTPINLISFEDILKTQASNSLFALDKCEVLLDQISKKEVNLNAIIGPEFLKTMLKILPKVQYYEPSRRFEPLRSVLSENKAISYGTKLEEYFELNQLTIQSLEQLKRAIITTTNDWKKELDFKLKEVDENFSDKLQILKEDVQRTIEKLVAQREKEISRKEKDAQRKIEELLFTFQNEAKVLEESTKSLYKYSGDILQSTPSFTSHEEFTHFFKENIRRIRLLLSSIEAAFHDTENYLKKIEVDQDEIQYSLQKDVKEINIKYNKLVSEQNERIILLKREFAEKLTSVSVSKEMLGSNRDKLLKKIETLRDGINEELEELNTFIILPESIPAALTKYAVISYIPCYITKFVNEENHDGTRFIVIPPCYLNSNYKALSKKMSLSTDPLFFDNIKLRLEIALKEHQELRRIFDTVCTENNFLKDKEIETMIYDGLKQLFEQKLISSKDYEKMSLACIEAFRR